MDVRDLWNIVERCIIGPVIGIALAVMLDVYRRARSMDTMVWHTEVLHLAVIATIIGWCAHAIGQSWDGVVYTLVVSVAVGHGYNGKWSFPSHAPPKEEPRENKP